MGDFASRFHPTKEIFNKQLLRFGGALPWKLPDHRVNKWRCYEANRLADRNPACAGDR
jgi:hypothetical protein